MVMPWVDVNNGNDDVRCCTAARSRSNYIVTRTNHGRHGSRRSCVAGIGHGEDYVNRKKHNTLGPADHAVEDEQRRRPNSCNNCANRASSKTAFHSTEGADHRQVMCVF